MKTCYYKISFFLFWICYSSLSYAQTSRSIVENEIVKLNNLIKEASAKGIDTSREEMTAHTALLFLDYSDYDESNYSDVLIACQNSPVYKNKAEATAKELPEFQRKETLQMVKDAIATLQNVINGNIIRYPVPSIDWNSLTIADNRVLNKDGKPVFFTDYNFKPDDERLTKYYGNLDGFHFDLSFLQENLQIPSYKKSELSNLIGSGNLGSPFLGHGIAKWMVARYPDITTGARLFTKYDIDHPQIRIFWDNILEQIVPYLKGQNRTKLGYLLANEPHWHTAACAWDTPIDEIAGAPTNWDTGSVSNYTIEKFKEWLKSNYENIEKLNSNWKESYNDFSDVTITIPLDNNLMGKAKWYDWMKFNQYRVTEWFKFLINTIRKYDPDAYANIKVMPSLWTSNKRDHGLDFEAICELSGVLGNDAASYKKTAWGGPYEWEQNYSFCWREMCMGYDFFRSVCPQKTIYNSEDHYLMHTGFQCLDLNKEYARCAYWLSTIMGCDANNSWVWSRNDDNENNKYPVNFSQAGDSHVGSVTTQPRILNEVTLTLMDLSSHGSTISEIQSLKQPIRIFYSETSAINQRTYMDNLFELYEQLFFKGVPLGFATQHILEKQDYSLYDVILIKGSDQVTSDELHALQKYLDNGGIIIKDRNSCTRNQYMVKFTTAELLKESKGKIITVNSVSDFVDNAFLNLQSSSKPCLEIVQSNSKNQDLCMWRALDNGNGHYILSLINMGNVESQVEIRIPGSSNIALCRDLLTGKEFSGKIRVNPEQVVFVELGNLPPLVGIDNVSHNNDVSVFPVPFNRMFNVTGVKNNVELFTLNGTKIQSLVGNGTITLDTQDLTDGLYILKIDGFITKKILKFN